MFVHVVSYCSGWLEPPCNQLAVPAVKEATQEFTAHFVQVAEADARVLKQNDFKSIAVWPQAIEKVGADGVRVGLLFCAPAGNDLLFDETLCNQGKNFSNKIWNAFRLIESLKIDDSQQSKSHNEFAIKWFNENLNKKVLSINESFKN